MFSFYDPAFHDLFINVLNVNYGMVLIKIKITLLSKHFREFVEETRLGHFIVNCINIAYIINIAFDLVTCFCDNDYFIAF